MYGLIQLFDDGFFMSLSTQEFEEKILRSAEQKALKMYGKRFASAKFVGKTCSSVVSDHCSCGGKRFTVRVLIKSNFLNPSDLKTFQAPDIVVCEKCFAAKEASVSAP